MDILEGLPSTPEVLDLFGQSRFVSNMLRFEASLARAQASVGLIPETAAQSIMDTCKVELFDVPKIVRESARVGNISLSLVKSLKETVSLFNPDAVGFVHYGATSQDVVTTALALATRDALGMIELEVHKVVTTLLMLAERHASAPALERSLTQPATVTSFGYKCVLWAAPLVRSLQRLQSTAIQSFSVQLSGAVATQIKMNGKRAQIIAHMATELNLSAQSHAWQTQQDEWVALGCDIALLVVGLGKMATDMLLMNQFEVGEVDVSMAMPTDRLQMQPQPNFPNNGAAFNVAWAAAQRAPQRLAALLADMPQAHEQSLGHGHAELAQWPMLLISAHDSARAMAQALSDLQVNTLRMRDNLDARRRQVPPNVGDECFSPLLAQHAAALTLEQIPALTNALLMLKKLKKPAIF